MADVSIDRFDPLLRDMLAFHLVEEGPEGTWVLRPDVSQRLAHLSRRPKAPILVYFGRYCEACQSHEMTRLDEGRYLCDVCRASMDATALAEHAPKGTAGRRRLLFRHRLPAPAD